VHRATLEDLRDRFAWNEDRNSLCQNLKQFLEETARFGVVRAAFVDGSFVTDKQYPADIDVGLEVVPGSVGTRSFVEFAAWFKPMRTRTTIRLDVYVYLPGGENDFSLFFQYVRSEDARRRGLTAGAAKGIVEIVF